MSADARNDQTLEQRLRLIEDRLDIYNLIASHPPSADTGAGDYTASVWAEDGVFDRGADRTGGNCRRLVKPGASPRHRAGARAFRRTAVRAGRRRHGLCDLLSADPRAGSRWPAVRRAESRLVARVPRASRLGESLGIRAHDAGLEDQPSHLAPARRHAGGARYPARRAGAVTGCPVARATALAWVRAAADRPVRSGRSWRRREGSAASPSRAGRPHASSIANRRRGGTRA
jgi:hypothetical protein